MMHERQTLLIAGSRWATPEMLEFARKCVQRALVLNWLVIVGDAPRGVDAEVIKECTNLGVPHWVCYANTTPRMWSSTSILKQYGKSYTERDRWMCEQADRAMFIWNGKSSGTKAGYQYMLALKPKPNIKHDDRCWLYTF